MTVKKESLAVRMAKLEAEVVYLRKQIRAAAMHKDHFINKVVEQLQQAVLHEAKVQTAKTRDYTKFIPHWESEIDTFVSNAVDNAMAELKGGSKLKTISQAMAELRRVQDGFISKGYRAILDQTGSPTKKPGPIPVPMPLAETIKSSFWAKVQGAFEKQGLWP